MKEFDHVANTPAPRRPGELAVLSYEHLPTYLKGCRDHVFRVGEAVSTMAHKSQSGYMQKGECLNCGRVTPLLDASWWERSPSAEQLAQLQK